MRTKSLRIASVVSSSTMRVPVRPPARPVATTGTSSALSARATLIPLPPASVCAALARCRWPSWKFGTVSVRSSAALSVTVMIIALRDPRPDVLRRVLCVEADASEDRRLRDRTGGDERPRGDDSLAVVDADRPEALALVHGQAHRGGRDDASRERPVDANRAARLRCG